MAKKKAFARYTRKGQLVPGSLVVTTQGGYPDKSSLWKEVPTWFNDNATISYGNWKAVTGGIAGDGVILTYDTDQFTFIGPNDDNDNGWVYLKQFFTEEKFIYIEYSWSSFDGGIAVDRPVYWTSATEPTGIPEDTTSKAEDTPENASWSITVPAGQWFAVGIYSTDSCCGRGFLQTQISISNVSYTYLINTLTADATDATGNTGTQAILGPNGNYYTPENGKVYAYDGLGGTGGTGPKCTNYPLCSNSGIYVWYFKNNNVVLIDRPGTIVNTETTC